MSSDDIYKQINSNKLIEPYYEEGYCCNTIQVEPMFPNIKSHMEPIKLLAEHFKEKYYEELYEKYKDSTLDVIDGFSDMDEILLQYIKCRPNMRAYITDKESKCSKILTLNKKQLAGFLFQIKIYENKYSFNEINELRDNIMKNRNGVNLYILFTEEEHYSLIHSTRTFIETIEVAMLCCNKNSIRLLQYQRLDRLLHGNYLHSRTLLMTYKKWLYLNVPFVDHGRFLIFSGSVLYTLGVRNLSDIDLIVISDNYNEKQLQTFFVDEGKFPFIDFHERKDNKWYHQGVYMDYLSEWFDKEWPSLYNAESMINTVYNPKFHYYFLGIKIICMEADIKRRIKRSRPAAYADLIAIIKFTNQKIEIPKLDKGYWKEHIYYDFTPAELSKLINTTQWHLKKKYHIAMSLDEIKNVIMV